MSENQSNQVAGIGAPADSPGDGPPSSRREFRWGAWATVGWTLAMVAATLLGVGGVAVLLALAGSGAGAGGGSFPDALMRVADDHLAGLTMAQAVISAGLVVLLTRPWHGVSRARMLGLERIGARRLAAGVAAILVAVFLLTEVPQYLLGISDRAALKWITELSPQWLAVLLIVIAAPVSEELIFRGFIYGGLAPSAVGPIGAVVLTSAIWAVVHVQYSWPVMLQIFIYGLVFGVARWRMGSLWPPMVAHGLINLYAAVAAYWTFGASG